VLQGGNALVTDGGSNLGQQYMNLNYQNQDASIAGQQDLMQSMQLVFDSQLARTNQHYGNLMQDLQQDFQKQSQLATQQAAALNPYSEAQGAMTAKNFQGAISNEYNKQSARLQEAATIAQNELAAGNAQAYVQISNAMKESNRNFQKGMMEYVMGLQAAEQQQQNWQSDFGLKTAGFGLDQQEFELKQKESGEKTFNDFIENFSQDPTFKANLNQFYQTGEVNEGLAPLIERGMAAGYNSPEEVLAVAEYQTEQQRQFKQQMDLNWFNAETSRYKATKPTDGGGVTISGEGEGGKLLNKALTQALAGSMTDTQRSFVVQLAKQQGLPGLLSWAAENKLGEEQNKSFQEYNTAAATLKYVSGQLENPETTFSPYKSLSEKSKPWLLIKRDSRYIELRQTIEFAQAQIKRGFYGTAITPTESGPANNFIINDNDDLETVKIKVRNLSNILRFANDKTTATTLGVGDKIDFYDYVEGTSSEEIKQKQQNTNVIFGLPNQTGSSEYISDDQISNWWSNK